MRKAKRRPISMMAMANLDAWVHTPRTAFMLVFTVMLCYLEVNNFTVQLEQNGWAINLVEVPFQYVSYGINIPMSSMLMLVAISELPRELPYQQYMLIRSDRRRWLTAQLFFSFLIVISVLLLMIFCLLLFSLPSSTHAAGWSDADRIENGGMSAEYALVPSLIRETFAPLPAALYAAIPVFFFWFSMAMVILLCSLLGARSIGLILCAFVVLAHFVGAYDAAFYPIKFATVLNIDPDRYGPEKYWATLAGYLLLNGAMISAMFWRVSSSDLATYSENKE